MRDEGIHRVTHEQLLAAGIDLAGVPAARIAVVDNGVGVPRYVEASGGVFGPGGYIEFVARPQLTLASPVDAYVLTLDARKAIAVTVGGPGRGASGVTVATDRYRPDNIYTFASPNGDPWFDATALAWGAPATLSRTFDLPNLAAGPVNLKIRLWGYGDLEGAAPDHHVIVKLNGTEVAQRTFDGFTPWEPAVERVRTWLLASGNVLEIASALGHRLRLRLHRLRRLRGDLQPRDRGPGRALPGHGGAHARLQHRRFRRRRAGGVWKVAGGTTTRQLRQPVGGAVVAVGGPGNVYAASQSALYRPGIVAGVPAAQAVVRGRVPDRHASGVRGLGRRSGGARREPRLRDRGRDGRSRSSRPTAITPPRPRR